MLLKACASESPTFPNSVSSAGSAWPGTAPVNGDNAMADGLRLLIFPLRGFDELEAGAAPSAAASIRGEFC